MGRGISKAFSSAPGASGSVGTPAPDILSATAVPKYGLLGNSSSFGFTVTINLPTTDPNYSAHFKSIEVFTSQVGGTSKTSAAILSSAFVGTSVTFDTPCSNIQGVAPLYYVVSFTPKNENGAPTVSAVTVAVTIQGSFVTSVAASD